MPLKKSRQLLAHGEYLNEDNLHRQLLVQAHQDDFSGHAGSSSTHGRSDVGNVLRPYLRNGLDASVARLVV